MTDTILILLAVDILALLLVGACATAVPRSVPRSVPPGVPRGVPRGVSALGATLLSGLGLLLCLPALLFGTANAGIVLPAGPPGMSLRLALDPLAACFLLMAFLAGTAIAAYQATMTPGTGAAPVRTTPCCLAGTALALLAADGVTLAIGLGIACCSVGLPLTGRRGGAILLAPLLVMGAVLLLAPAGSAPSFEAIRGAPADATRAAAAALTIAASAGMIWSRAEGSCRSRDALAAGVLIPTTFYLLLRLVADLPGAAEPAGSGCVLLLAGGAFAVAKSWSAASDPDIAGSVAGLVRRHAGLGMAGTGLALSARAADLPGAASVALAATFLAALASSVAGVAASLSVEAIGGSAGTGRLSRLGGLVHSMPITSAALASGLLGLAAVPPGLGFASLWMLFEAVLSAPRTAGLLSQLPLALTAAAIALSAALAAAASVRVAGIALLGRPRTPRGAGAQEVARPARYVLLAMGGLALLAGVLPGPALWLLAAPAIGALTGAGPNARGTTMPNYGALPVLALVALATAAAMLAPRLARSAGSSLGETKTAGAWTDGMAPPAGLPFGDPAAQSVGEGFLPEIRFVAPPRLPKLPRLPRLRAPSANAGLWLVLGAFAALLAVLAAAG